ncbi:MAG: lysoplasmalogenase [Actinomycetes bacterium]
MTGTAWAILVLTACAAVADWIAVAWGRVRVEFVAKPAATAGLVVLACAVTPVDPSVRTAFVVALVLSLIGDVLLMLPSDRFVPGLVAFLLAHVAYVVGFALSGGSAGALALGAVVTVVVAAPLGVRLLRAIRVGEPALVVPVAVYMSIISAMVACATGWGNAWAVAGAWLFFSSDALIAEHRFVHPSRWGRVAVIVTYHLGQAGLVLSLVH